MTMNNQVERELSWDDTIEKESNFTLLEEGEYPFVVKSFERARHPGSQKLPPCNKAILTLQFPDDVEIKHNLFLHSKTEGLLSNFFICIGHKKPGEKSRMNWQKVPGSRGMAKVGIRKWTDDNGRERESNEVVSFIEPDPSQQPYPPQQYQQPHYQQGGSPSGYGGYSPQQPYYQAPGQPQPAANKKNDSLPF